MWIRTPMLEVQLKSFGCKRLNLIEYFWHDPCASLLYSLWPLFFGFCFLFLGFALHNIHAFHSWLFLVDLFFQIKKKREEKGSKLCFALFSWFWKQGWSIYFHITCLLYLLSFDDLTYCTLLVKALWCMLCGKNVYGFDHLVLILKSHVFDCWTWTFWERHK